MAVYTTTMSLPWGRYVEALRIACGTSSSGPEQRAITEGLTVSSGEHIKSFLHSKDVLIPPFQGCFAGKGLPWIRMFLRIVSLSSGKNESGAECCHADVQASSSR